MTTIPLEMMKTQTQRIKSFLLSKVNKILALSELREIFKDAQFDTKLEVILGKHTILFTDIVGSSDFYNHVGDAQAFVQVRDHFQEIFNEIHIKNGVVVKTIGDSVMASFKSPDDAIAAAIKIQERFHHDRKDTCIRLRIAIHSGPVIAVQLKTGIDFFGHTVNYAAKIQTSGGAGEVVLSDIVHTSYQKNAKSDFKVEKRTKQGADGASEEIFVVRVSAPKQLAA